MTQAAIMPKRPVTTAELAECLAAAAAADAQVRFTGSNSLPLTRFDSGQPVQVISTLRLNKLIEHAVADMTVIVQAGMSLEALQRQLAWQNQWLPVDPPSYRAIPPGQRTIGGLIASNSLGPLRFGVGDWRLLVMGMTWVDAGGAVIKGGGRTVKNVAGYSTPRVMIGSCGSLGAIAEVTLRTFARPADEQCVIFFADSAQRAENLIAEIMLSPTAPAYVEAIGGRTFSANPLQLPTMKRGVAVAVGFMDRPQSCAAQIESLRALPGAAGLESISQTAAQAGRLRLWLTSEPAIESESGSLGARMHTLSSRACDLITSLESAAAKLGGTAWTVSEAATGVVRTVITAPKAEALLQKIADAHAATYFITNGADRAAGAADVSTLAMRIKSQLDPKQIFGQPSGPNLTPDHSSAGIASSPTAHIPQK